MVHTRLAEVRKKKHILQTNENNVNNDNNSISSNNDASSNLFSGNLLKVVCETQTQIINPTYDDDVSLKGFELNNSTGRCHSTEENVPEIQKLEKKARTKHARLLLHLRRKGKQMDQLLTC